MPRPNRTLPSLILAALVLPVASSALPIRVVLMGDSITGGTVADGGVGYADALTVMLGPDYAVSNIACAGTSSLDWTLSLGVGFCAPEGPMFPNIYTRRAQPELPAEIVTILLGTNDAFGFFEPEPVSAADYGDALAEISSNLFLDGAEKVVLMTPPTLLFSSAFPHQRIIAYREEVLDLCGSEPDIVCGPDVFALLGRSDFVGTNVHPNAAGHAKIAEALFDTVISISPIPEPGPLPLAACGLAALAAARRRSRRAKRASRTASTGTP